MRPASIRYSVQAASRARLVARPALHPSLRAQAPTARRVQHPQFQAATRAYANGSSAGEGNSGMYIVLGAILALAGGGYFYLKPVRDVAAKLNSGMEMVKDKTDAAAKAGKNAVETAKDVAGVEKGGSIADIAQAVLPAGAFALYSKVSADGSMAGVLSSLKDTDVQETLESVKKYGGEDVAAVVDKVQAKLKEAKGDPKKVDWKGLATDLNKEYGGKYKSTVDFLIGKVPSTDDFDKYFDDLKKMTKDQLKGLEDAAKGVYAEVEKASKDGKDTSQAFVNGIKKAGPEDVDKLVQQLKSTAKEAGLPADYMEKWLKNKAGDKLDDAEAWAKDIEKRLNDLQKWMPVEPEVVVEKVSEISPSLGKLLEELLKEGGKKIEEGANALKEGKKQADKVLKK